MNNILPFQVSNYSNQKNYRNVNQPAFGQIKINKRNADRVASAIAERGTEAVRGFKSQWENLAGERAKIGGDEVLSPNIWFVRKGETSGKLGSCGAKESYLSAGFYRDGRGESEVLHPTSQYGNSYNDGVKLANALHDAISGAAGKILEVSADVKSALVETLLK